MARSIIRSQDFRKAVSIRRIGIGLHSCASLRCNIAYLLIYFLIDTQWVTKFAWVDPLRNNCNLQQASWSLTVPPLFLEKEKKIVMVRRLGGWKLAADFLGAR